MFAVKFLFIDCSCRESFDKDVVKGEVVSYLRAVSECKLMCFDSIYSAKQYVCSNKDDIFVFILWVDYDGRGYWRELLEFTSPSDKTIIVLDSDIYDRDEVYEINMRGMIAFAKPFNIQILKSYLEFVRSKVIQYRLLDEFKKFSNSAKDIKSMVKYSFDLLKGMGILDFCDISISLVDNTDNRRYLLYYDNIKTKRNFDRNLLIPISEDTLMKRVVDDGIVLISDLDEKERSAPYLKELGWVDSAATNWIKSWMGMSIHNSTGKLVAIITFGHDISGYYGGINSSISSFIRKFGIVVANAIDSFMISRNQDLLRSILNCIGSDLEAKQLINRVMSVINSGLLCDNCTYFSVISSPGNKNQLMLKQSADAYSAYNTSDKPYSFLKNVGVAGCVLADGRSRIIAHALQSKEFVQTAHISGNNESMLVVRVLSQNEQKNIIGVISCRRNMVDHFNPYDRDLLESIADNIATIIERTTILEYVKNIGSQINSYYSLTRNKKKEILRKICQYALDVTTASEAIIHRFDIIADEDNVIKYKSTDESYSFPDGAVFVQPRMGEGTTNIMIKEKKIVQFSKEDKNYESISLAQKDNGVLHLIAVPLVVSDQDDEIIIGGLYLNKYTNGRFTEIEEFSLRVLANLAANAIKNMGPMYEWSTWNQTNEILSRAIERVSLSNDMDKLLNEAVIRASQLVDDARCYIGIINYSYTFKFKINNDEYRFMRSRFKEFKSNVDCEVLCNLQGSPIFSNFMAVVESKNTLIILDRDNDEKFYFNRESKSQMIIPIIRYDSNEEVIALIVLEKDEINNFTRGHDQIMKIFAHQLAIAFQKNRLLLDMRRRRDLSTRMQNAIQHIGSSSPQDMLISFLNLIRDVVGAHMVLFIPGWIILHDNNKLRGDELQELVYTYDYDKVPRSFISNIARVDGKSRSVYDDQRYEYVKSSNDLNPIFHKINVQSGICFPVTDTRSINGQDRVRRGVIWVMFKDDTSLINSIPEEDVDLITGYINHFINFLNSEKIDNDRKKILKKQEDFAGDIRTHYTDARFQSILYFTLSLITSFSGMLFIIYSIFSISFSGVDMFDPRPPMVFTSLVGVILEAAGVLIFTRVTDANKRMDYYHGEMFRVKQLNILLNSTDRIDSEKSVQLKNAIIDNAAKHWFSDKADQNQPKA